MNYQCPPGPRLATQRLAFLMGLGYTYEKLSGKIKVRTSMEGLLNFNVQCDLFTRKIFPIASLIRNYLKSGHILSIVFGPYMMGRRGGGETHKTTSHSPSLPFSRFPVLPKL